MSDNPLAKYTTKPGMFVKLPSNGRYYASPPKLTADGDIEVHPMTAIDELYLKNPDGLYNNESLVKVFKNTVPGIIDPSNIPTPDLDALFIAIRMATYGSTMDVSAPCKHCKHIDQYAVDLEPLLQTAASIPDVDTVEIDGLVLHITPYTVNSNARISEYAMMVAKAAKKAQTSILDDTNDVLRRELSDTINTSTQALIGITAQCIVSIDLPEPDQPAVTDPKFIMEFITKLSAPDYGRVKTCLTSLSREVIDRSFKYKCEQCDKENTGEVSFDPAHFFG